VGASIVCGSRGFNPKVLNAAFLYNHTLRYLVVTKRLDFDLTPVADPGLCCSLCRSLFDPATALSRPMLRAKVDTRRASRPIATANVGCYAYLREEARVPVVHWVELLG
jgi:glycolate oxidase iron-sulfur subunit